MRMIDTDRLPVKSWKKTAAMFQDDYTAGAGTDWALKVAMAENRMLWEIISAIENAPTLTPPNEWVSVEDRLPKINAGYIVCCNDEDCPHGEGIWYQKNVVVYADYYDGSWTWYEGSQEYDLEGIVTHWMPIPAPPDRRPPEGEESKLT